MIKKTWQSKISPEAIEFAKIIAETIDMILEEPEKFLRFGDEALKNLKAHNLPDWTRFYERSPKFMTNFISTMLGIQEEKQPAFPSKDIGWIEELPSHFMNVDWGSQELEERGTKFLDRFKTKFLFYEGEASAGGVGVPPKADQKGVGVGGNPDYPGIGRTGTSPVPTGSISM